MPQGSILSQLLFSLSINSLSALPLSVQAALKAFADDLVLYRPICCAEDSMTLQADSSTLVEWVKSMKLRLNVISKTKTKVISRKHVRPRPSIMVDGLKVEEVMSFKYLSVHVTTDLSWHHYIGQTCVKAKKLKGFIYRSFRQVDTRCHGRLFKSLVRPVLEYCSAAWDPHQAFLIDKLERVQGFVANFVAKVVTRDWLNHGAVSVAALGWPKLALRRSYQKVCVCRRILQGSSIIPSTFFSPHPSLTQRSTQPSSQQSSSPKLNVFVPEVLPEQTTRKLL